MTNLHLLVADPFYDAIGYLIVSLIGLVIVAWVFAAMFGSTRKRKLMQIQTMLMIQMAEKQGVNTDTIINSVYAETEKPGFLIAVGKR